MDSGFDAGQRRPTEEGTDAGRVLEEAGRSSDDGWVMLTGVEDLDCTIPVERARDPEAMFAPLTEWEECGAGCRELRLPLLEGSGWVVDGWYDPLARAGYVSLIHGSDAGLLHHRVLGLDGITHVALRAAGAGVEASVQCLLHGVRLGGARWATTGSVRGTSRTLDTVWQGSIMAGGADALRSDADGTLHDINAEHLVLRSGGGTGIVSIGRSGEVTEVPIEPHPRVVVQRIGLAGADILYHYHDYDLGSYGLRLIRGGDTRVLLSSNPDDELHVSNYATEGEMLIWTEGRYRLGGTFEAFDLRASPYGRSLDELAPRYVTTFPPENSGVASVGYGYAVLVHNTNATVFRLSDGSHWSLPLPRGFYYRQNGALFLTAEEVALPIHEAVAGGQRAYSVRLVRWDSLSPPAP